jgi:hypothetical protein
MRYLSYTEYRNFGGKLDVADFTRQIFGAEKRVDMYTFGRLIREAEISAAVKACVRELLDYMQSTEKVGNGDTKIASVSNDGVSISYAAEPSYADKAKREEDIVTLYLATEKDSKGVPLLYRGV